MLIVDEPMGVTEAAQVPHQRSEPLLDAAVRYAEERHWDVFPGAWLEVVGGRERCSCGDAGCALPGAHADRPDWAGRSTGSGAAARRMWTRQPRSSVLLPTGRAFDALEVPEAAGFLALARMERMDLTLGPVTRTPDRRMLFFVLPGAAAKVTDLVRSLGWNAGAIDLTGLGEGHYVAAPPTRVGGRGAVQWARRPDHANRWLPEVDELISPLAYACAREAADARVRTA
ncbi:bifunctional DNA primase/polymerase [Streptomyces californicus]|uniref:Bifunctional DNA primase/polymerase n=2 Tax=Streptomyces TaxID=1883 RepID=A0ABD7D168_9ACTN|nr:bifunctional DNA primase/polymerase [Streptomyces californicus]QRV34999.1 bifunctional DNA primase/polymerase [Streptomyces californicus]QRV42808.1 bifunctional DNA primase/polymerase [Streptomyces californicus]QRV49495.1 bifunctional DNA primase/polymerase [Streptomyces californicus]